MPGASWRSFAVRPASRFRGFDDAVSDVGDGLDRRRFSELASQSADGDLDGVAERVDVLVPYLGEEVLGAEDGVLGAHQRLEHRELLGGEVEPPSVAGGGVVEGVEFDSRGPEDPGLGGRAGDGRERGCGARARGSGMALGGSRRPRGCRPLTRCAGVSDAVSISTIAGFSRSVIMRQIGVAVQPGEVAVEDDDVVGVEIELHRRLESVIGDVDRHRLRLAALRRARRRGCGSLRRRAPSCWRSGRCPDREGQGDRDAQPALGEGFEVERAAVNLDDRGDDREPEAGALVRSGPLGADAPERLCELLDLLGVEDRAAVLDDETRALVLDRRW